MSANKEVKFKTIIYSVIIIVIGYTIIIGSLIYLFGIDNRLTRKTARVIPYPAAIVGANFITVNKLLSQLGSAKTFYENQDFGSFGLRVDFSTDDGKKRLKIKEKNILNKLIENSIIESEARDRGIKITSDIIDQAVDRKLKEYGTDEYLRQNLKKLYGWEMEDFKENIVKPDLYKEKLFQDIKKNDSSYAQAQERINAAQKDLAGGKKFEEVAAKYSEGKSADRGGELGWFDASQMLPEIALAVLILNKGQTSEVIESSIGYHIVKVEDKKNEDNENKIKISQVYIKTKPFSDWITEMEKNKKIIILPRDFKWNADLSQVEFRSEKMKNFEKNLVKNSPDDISVMF